MAKMDQNTLSLSKINIYGIEPADDVEPGVAEYLYGGV